MLQRCAAKRDGWPSVRLNRALLLTGTTKRAPDFEPRCISLSRTSLSQPFHTEAASLLDALLTRQAVKTLLHYASETNGEVHLFLHTYIADVGAPKVDAEGSAARWLSDLAATPLQRLHNPGRSSIASPAAMEQALGEREVSPRDVVERILALRVDIAAELSADLEKVAVANGAILRATLARTLSEAPPLED